MIGDERMNDKITIIVPIYNVEKYLDRCIQSIICQTYKNIEIILVDDGSTDSSLKICNNYKTDNRIIILHKNNGGLSSARNYGLKYATGKYLYFLDSDDYICANTIEILYKNAKENNACITCGKELFVYDSTTNLGLIKNYDSDEFSNEIALEKILYMNGISNSSCNKLYKTKLFSGITFPEGELYEDLGTIYKVFGIAKRIVTVNAYTYNYFMRHDSITHIAFREKEMVTLKFSSDILAYVEENYKNIIPAAKYKYDMEAIMLFIKIPPSKKYKKENDIVKSVISKYNRDVIKDKKVPYNWKIICVAAIFGKRVAVITWNTKLYIKKLINKFKRR